MYQVQPAEHSYCPDCTFTGDTLVHVVNHVLEDHPEIIEIISRREKLREERKLIYLMEHPPSTPIGNIF